MAPITELSETQKTELKNNFINRLEAFKKGAMFVVSQTENKKIENIFEKYKNFAGTNPNPKKLKMALALFMQELAKELKISMKDIQRGESYWAWQTSKDRKREFKSKLFKINPKYESSEIKNQVEFNISEKFIELPLTDDQKKELLKTLISGQEPDWFKKRSSWEQKALKKDLRQCLELDESQNLNSGDEQGYLNHSGWDIFAKRSIPATLKWLPIVGASVHILKVNGKEYKTYRVGAPVSYDAPLKVQQYFTEMNMRQISQGLTNYHYGEESIEGKRKILLLSLITGKNSEGWMSYLGIRLYDWTVGHLLGPFKENNARWVSMADQAIEKLYPETSDAVVVKNEVFCERQTDVANHSKVAELPIGHDNRGINYFRSDTPGEIKEEYIQSLNGDNPFEAALSNHNEKIRGYKASSFADKYDRNPNLFSAALMDAAERCEGGISAGHCKSSKDRKGMALLMADAIIIYQVHYGTVPEYDDEGENRENFLDIASYLYQTGVYADVADFHSPGSKGLKDDGFTPKDLQKRLAMDYQLSKIQASWNKPSFGFLLNTSKSLTSPKALFAIGVIGIGLMVAGALLTGPFAPLFLAGLAVLFVGIFANIHQFSKEGSLQREIDKESLHKH